MKMKALKTVMTMAVVVAIGGLAGAGELVTDWDLTDLYPNMEAWEAAKAEIPVMAAEIDKYQGTLGEGPANLKAVMDLSSNASKEAARLYTYANLMSDLDIREPGPLGMKQELQQLFTELAATVAWVDPEILSLGWDTIERYLTEEPGLEIYRRSFEQLEKQRAHILNSEGEEIMSLAGMMQGDGNTIGSILRNAEIPWRTITLSDGSELRVDANGYTRGRASDNRDDRKLTYDAFYGALADYQESLAATLAATVKGHLFNSKVRGYENTLAAALAGSEVDTEVYETLIREVNASLPTLYRYLELRARMLGIEHLEYYDLYPSLVGSVESEYPWARAVDEVLQSFEPMGEEYVSYVRNACEQGWIDVYPGEAKRSGAYMSGSAYDVHPYMLLNHQDDYESTSTFAHKAGHMMHSAYSMKTQPFPTAGYETFVAEVASTTQQWLFFKYSMANAANDDEKLAILGNFLESFRTTVFRQTMFSEFERSMHELLEQGKPVTSATLNTLYLDILRRYHGHDQGVCTIDEEFQVEWAFIPHFHYNYYVYTYATSFIAATAFQEQILTGDNGGVERYIDNLLKAGSSKPPVEILKDAGVDMTTAAPFQAAMKAMNEIMDEIEAILAKK